MRPGFFALKSLMPGDQVARGVLAGAVGDVALGAVHRLRVDDLGARSGEAGVAAATTATAVVVATTPQATWRRRTPHTAPTSQDALTRAPPRLQIDLTLGHHRNSCRRQRPLRPRGIGLHAITGAPRLSTPRRSGGCVSCAAMPDDPKPAAEPAPGGAAVAPSWWRDGVLYQIYPRSFADSDGDGIGDLQGIIGRLDHLEWLGVDGIWLNPTMPSPNDDWGYDVADYCGVHPDLGTLEDLEALVAEAGRGDPRAARPRPQPHERPPRLVPGRARWPRGAAPRLLRVGRPQARRLAAQQLAELLRRLGVGARRGQRPVLPAQLPAHPARPQLVERRGARRVRRHPALLVRARGRRASASTSATRSSRTASCATTPRPRPTTTRSSSGAGSSRSSR